MTKLLTSIFIALSTTSSLMAMASNDFEKNPVIEHQIRICDSESKIIKKLGLDEEVASPRDVLYIETPDQFYKNSGWVLRIKVKNSKVILDIKKRIAKGVSAPDIKDLECELDKHDLSLEKTCKLSREMSVKELTKIINNNYHWKSALSHDQKIWLESSSVIRNDAQFLGVLSDNRYEINHESLGVMTLDIVHLEADENISYHEISVRYPAKEEAQKALLFENFIMSKKILLCPGQMEWSINKFDVMTTVESL